MLQIKRIILYSRRGEPRELLFRSGSVNIITGGSSTGKSSLLELIEFCLSGRDCTLPHQVQNVLDWCVLVLNAHNTDIVIGRPIPAIDTPANMDAFLRIVESDSQSVTYADLRVNSTTDEVNDVLTRFTNPGHRPMSPLETTIRSITRFCFQAQSEIANPRFLFHGQDEPSSATSLRLSLPYALGAANPVSIQIAKRLRHLKAQRNAIDDSRKKPLIESPRSSELTVASELVDLGLLPQESLQYERSALLDALARVHEVERETPTLDGGNIAFALDDLQERYQAALEKLRRLRGELATLRGLADNATGFASAVKIEIGRLDPVENAAAHKHEGHTCPVCSSTLAQPVSVVEEMRNRMVELRRDIEAIGIFKPSLSADIDQREAAASLLRRELHELRNAIQFQLERRDELLAQHGFSVARAVALGKVDLLLSHVEFHDDETREDELDALNKNIDNLEQQLSDLSNNSIPIYDQISRLMTELSELLYFPYSGYAVRIEPSLPTAELRMESGAWRPLAKIGSAQNALALHLVSHLALHIFFVHNERPVPSFIVLDQPTQAYFPSDMISTHRVDAADSDRLAVSSIFKLLQSVVDELAGEFQIIVLDHADPDSEDFQNSVIERWRTEGKGLLPKHWINEETGTTE